MLLTTDAIVDASQVVEAPHFYKPAHQSIFAAIGKLFDAGQPIDVVTVTNQLHAEGHANIGTGDLMSLSAGTPAATNAEHYAEIVELARTITGCDAVLFYSALLRSPEMKRACWQDIQLAMAELGLPRR